MNSVTETPRIVHPGHVTDENRSRFTVIDKRVYKGREYTLGHRTAGYEPAGSMARWCADQCSVTTYIDGATHGQRGMNEIEARELFDKWTEGGAA